MNNIKKFYWAAFFGNWSFATGILIFHYRELGFSFFQIFLLAAIYEGLNFLLEIPTGVLADIWGYKKTTITGCFISGISFFVVLINPEVYSSYVIWAVLSAICTTLNSGTYDAFIYESVQYEDGFTYSKVLGSIRFISFSTQAVCIILGGLFSDWIGFNLALLLSGIGGLMQAVVLVTMKEIVSNMDEAKNCESDLKKRASCIIASSIIEVKKSIELQKLLLVGVLLFLVSQYVNTIFQPFLETIGFDSHLLIAFISAVSFLLLGFGSKVISKIATNSLDNRQKVIIVLLSISMPLFFLFSKITGLIAFSVLFIVFGMSEVLYSTIVNEVIPSDIRATILSFQNQLFSVMYSIAAICLGVLLDKTNIVIISTFTGIGIMMMLLIYLSLKKIDKIVIENH